MSPAKDTYSAPAREPDAVIGRQALSKASWHLLPLIGLGYGVAYLDRVNISFAALRMNADLHFSASIYGLGGGLFFLAYALFEIPSNLLMLKVGPRRWLARIMFTWGLLAVGMMFVRTPMQFYVMRFLLGAAEAGFFPGAIIYLMRWFPVAHRGRAVSRFYVAYPLSTVVMGALAGALLGLQGRLGLAGWQWLFLIEGLPALALSIVFLNLLPDGPDKAAWLSTAERTWIASQLAADDGAVADQRGESLGRILANPMVLGMGIVNMLVLGSSYAFVFSAPALLEAATHLGVSEVGFLVASGGGLGAVFILAVSWSSDRVRERHLHLAVPLTIGAAAYFVMAVWHSPVPTIGAYLVSASAAGGAAAVFWTIPGDVLRGRSAAVGVAAINAIGMVGSFLAPTIWGALRDRTGGYGAGLHILPICLLIAAGIVLALRFRARRLAAPPVLAPARG